MKDYKRLTERDKFGNADIIGEDVGAISEKLSLEELNLSTKIFNLLIKTLNRLVDLEDKIESGELCDREEVAREIFEELYDDIPLGFNTITLSKDTIKDRAEAYGVILEDEE